MRRPTGDDGTIIPLIAGFFIAALLMLAVVVDVSALVLAKRGAQSAADSAAIAAAQQLSERELYERGLDSGEVPLDPELVGATAADVGRDAAETQSGLRLFGRVEDGAAVVRGERTVRLPFSSWLDVEPVVVRVEARARAPVVGP